MQVRNTKAVMPKIPPIWGMSATGPKRSAKTVGRECGEEKAGFAAD
jgi:hypothetical protein